MNKIIDKIGKHPWVVFLANFITIGLPAYGLLRLLKNGMTPTEYINNVNWIEIITVFLLTVIVYYTLKRSNEQDKKILALNNQLTVFNNQLSSMITENNERLKSSWTHDIATVHAGVIKITMDNNKYFEKRLTDLDAVFFSLNADFASLSHYYQGNQALMLRDFKGEYSNFIHSVKHSINSGICKIYHAL